MNQKTRPSGNAPASDPDSPAPLIEVEGLTVTLAGRVALEDVDLSVAHGELVGVIGPNGAGKTTLLRSLLGLVPAAAGRIRIEGEPPRRARARVGYVPQRHEFAWDFPISVEGAVMTGRTRRIGWFRRAGQADRDAVDHALALAGIDDLRARPLGELSGGQRQRVLLARALALEPKIVLLDEPLSGLDIPTQEALSTVFERLRRDGCALLMATHHVQSAVSGCGRLVLLNRTVVAQGTWAELREPGPWLEAFGVGASAQLFEEASVRA